MREDQQKRYVRFVNPDDALELQRIYSYYVEQTVVSFEYESPSVEEFENRIRKFSRTCPYLVFCENESILGYAYAHPAFEREAYSWCAETTVYVTPTHKGSGIGSSLYRTLIYLLERLGYKILYAVIVAENTESVLFHQKQGFHLAATFPKAGFKFNRWLDVQWYELDLGEFGSNIQKPSTIKEISLEELNGISLGYDISFDINR